MDLRRRREGQPPAPLHGHREAHRRRRRAPQPSRAPTDSVSNPSLVRRFDVIRTGEPVAEPGVTHGGRAGSLQASSFGPTLAAMRVSERVQAQRDEAPSERRWLILAVLCFSLLVIVLDNSILNVALPAIVRELDATNTQLQWIVDSYTLVFAGLLLTAGSLGDRFGRRPGAPGRLPDLRAGLAGVRAGRLTGDADPQPGLDGRGRGVHHAGHPVHHHQRLPRPRAGQGHRCVGGHRRPRAPRSARWPEASSSSTSTGARCSS